MTETLEPMMPKIRSPLFIPKNLPKFINSTSFLNEIELIFYLYEVTWIKVTVRMPN